MRFKMIVSYDGTCFYGFQKQNELRTVQSEIEKVLSKVLKQTIEVCASGRTDAKVHALGQVIHFDTTVNITCDGLKKVANKMLPKDIYVKDVQIVDYSFHARYNALRKTYHYLVDLGEYNPFYANYRCYYMYKNLDIDLMKKCCDIFIGEHDFRSFTKNTEALNTVRTMYSLEICQEDELLIFKFEGNGFLHNQVRIITAMILEVGRGKITLDYLRKVMEAKNRNFAPKVLGGEGLYLISVKY